MLTKYCGETAILIPTNIPWEMRDAYCFEWQHNHRIIARGYSPRIILSDVPQMYRIVLIITDKRNGRISKQMHEFETKPRWRIAAKPTEQPIFELVSVFSLGFFYDENGNDRLKVITHFNAKVDAGIASVKSWDRFAPKLQFFPIGPYEPGGTGLREGGYGEITPEIYYCIRCNYATPEKAESPFFRTGIHTSDGYEVRGMECNAITIDADFQPKFIIGPPPPHYGHAYDLSYIKVPVEVSEPDWNQYASPAPDDIAYIYARENFKEANYIIPIRQGFESSYCPSINADIRLSNNSIIKAKDLSVGMELASFDIKKREDSIATIKSFSIIESEMVKIIFDDDSESHCSNDHLVALSDSLLFIKANLLKNGDLLFGKKSAVKAIIPIGIGAVARINVEPFDTYFADGILCHNKE